jgi:hypothetical protein
MSLAVIIIRIILEVLGIIAIGAGLIGGIVTMFQQIARRGEKEKLASIDQLTAFIQALKQLLQALVASPVWLALVIIGIVLVFVGSLVNV